MLLYSAFQFPHSELVIIIFLFTGLCKYRNYPAHPYSKEHVEPVLVHGLHGIKVVRPSSLSESEVELQARVGAYILSPGHKNAANKLRNNRAVGHAVVSFTVGFIQLRQR